MSGTTTSGQPIGTLPAAGQAQDTDGILILQQTTAPSSSPSMAARLASPRGLISSYVPSGATLLAAGAGASRGTSGSAAPVAGDPFQGVGLGAALTLVVDETGNATLAVQIGTSASSAAAGNDARIVAGAAAASSVAALQSSVATLAQTVAALGSSPGQTVGGGGSGVSSSAVVAIIDGQVPAGAVLLGAGGAGVPFTGIGLAAATLSIAQVNGQATLEVVTGQPNGVAGLDANGVATIPGALRVGVSGAASIGLIAVGDGRARIDAKGLLLTSLPTVQPVPDPNGYAQLWNNGGILAVA